jgi:hypothetical protein
VLSAKLSTAQTQKNVPGSAVKTAGLGRGVIPSKGSLGGADDWTSRVKEELYGDLSGLLIMNVKKEPRSTLFECLQTGTNGGTYHLLTYYPLTYKQC